MAEDYEEQGEESAGRHEEVVEGLLDLQRRLRHEEAARERGASAAAAPVAPAPAAPVTGREAATNAVAVQERDEWVIDLSAMEAARQKRVRKNRGTAEASARAGVSSLPKEREVAPARGEARTPELENVQELRKAPEERKVPEPKKAPERKRKARGKAEPAARVDAIPPVARIDAAEPVVIVPESPVFLPEASPPVVEPVAVEPSVLEPEPPPVPWAARNEEPVPSPRSGTTPTPGERLAAEVAAELGVKPAIDARRDPVGTEPLEPWERDAPGGPIEPRLARLERHLDSVMEGIRGQQAKSIELHRMLTERIKRIDELLSE